MTGGRFPPAIFKTTEETTLQYKTANRFPVVGTPMLLSHVPSPQMRFSFLLSAPLGEMLVLVDETSATTGAESKVPGSSRRHLFTIFRLPTCYSINN